MSQTSGRNGCGTQTLHAPHSLLEGLARRQARGSLELRHQHEGVVDAEAQQQEGDVVVEGVAHEAKVGTQPDAPAVGQPHCPHDVAFSLSVARQHRVIAVTVAACTAT